jgi:hypothetical protein
VADGLSYLEKLPNDGRRNSAAYLKPSILYGREIMSTVLFFVERVLIHNRNKKATKRIL